MALGTVDRSGEPSPLGDGTRDVADGLGGSAEPVQVTLREAYGGLRLRVNLSMAVLRQLLDEGDVELLAADHDLRLEDRVRFLSLPLDGVVLTTS